MKIRPVEAELFPADRRTDVTKLVLAFAILRTRQNVGLSALQQTFVDLWTKRVGQGGNSSDLFESWPS